MMKQHLRIMSTMIRKLKVVGNNLIDEQRIQVGIHSFPDSWEHMVVYITNNDNIKAFDELSCHIELEVEHLEAANPLKVSLYLVENDSNKINGYIRKRNTLKKGANEPTPRKAKKTKHGKHW